MPLPVGHLHYSLGTVTVIRELCLIYISEYCFSHFATWRLWDPRDGNARQKIMFSDVACLRISLFKERGPHINGSSY